MSTETIVALVFAVIVIAILVFRIEEIWEIITIFMEWTMRQIARPFDWLIERFWP